ncbi:MAG: hypothetical protein CMF83_03470 [Candidatus Marinimicrobia bacterium]|nr:hypothetical protein [Candidatus Neomarinimicrobiota bacterium]MCS5648140.1 hypothetical protein [Dehalococcoidia bacterium]
MLLPIFIISMICLSGVKAEDPEIDISAIKYTNDLENGETVILVGNGKDGATVHNYHLYDDDDDQYRNDDDDDDCDVQSCLPENWYNVSFDDSNWNSSAAPFGNDDLDGVSPGTIWQSEDGSGDYRVNDHIVIRHYFNYDNEDDVISATLKVVHNNYYVAYLNGELIRNCYYYNYHDDCYENDPEYWKTNGDNFLTYDGSSESGPNPDWLVDGENLLAILAYDHCCYQGDQDQWIDVELVINVQSWKEDPIVLGDDLVLGIDFFNNEESNVTDLNVTLEIEGTEFANQTIEIEANKTFEWTVEWTPDRLGEFNVTAKVINESGSYGNPSLTRIIHVGHYAYNFSVADDYLVGNTSELLTYNITISNEGDVDDNYTFQLFGAFNDWDVEFVPNVINLAPGETGTVRLEITPDNGTYSGIYELTLTARSQYHGEITGTIVQSGRDNETEWKWVNSTGSRLYDADNTTWTEIDFEPGSNWTLAPAPFGDDDLGSIDYNTEWTGNNYAYFRHIFYIEDLSDYENATLSLNMAANNYGTYYLNGQEMFDDLGQGGGHYAQYWNEEIKFNTSLLKEGKNVLASVVRETGNTQWFDEELVGVTPKSSVWGFQPEYLSLKLEVLPVYAFELVAPISDMGVKEDESCCEQEWTYKFVIWAYNRGNIEDSYEINVTLNDTVNFSIVDVDSIIHAEFDEEVTINLTIVLNPSVTEFSVGEFNVSVTSMNSTEEISLWEVVKARLYIIPDTLPPGTYAQTPSLVNSSSFEVEWYIEDWYKDNEILGNDTKYFIIEYMTDNGTNGQTWGEWTVWGNFSSELKSEIFTYGFDGYRYRFRSIGGDDAGLVENKEDRYDTETLVDLSAPYAVLEVRMEGNITNINYIEIEWITSHQDVTGYSAQYRFNGGNWTTFEEDTLAKWAGFNAMIDGIYEFRVITTDMANNRGISEVSQNITVDTKAPNTRLIELPEFTDSEQIVINLTQIEDAVNFTLYYSYVREGQEVSPVEWDVYGDYLITDLPISINVDNQFHYYFKMAAYDLADNHLVNDSYEETIIDRDPPLKVRNLAIRDGKIIENGTVDVILEFQSSQSQDLAGYRIYRSTDPNETGELIESMKSSGKIYLTYRDIKVNLGATYYYSVMAVDRMEFESEAEIGFIDLVVEEEPIVEDSESETQDFTGYMAGIMVLLAAGILGGGYYFLSPSSPGNIVVGEVVGEGASNFTEVDGELLCGACGAMFELTDERSCPSCGVFDD